MKTFSHLALALALTTGAGGLVLAPPAMAQKKNDKKDAGLKLSPEVLKAAQVAQPAIQARDVATAEPAVAQAEAGVKTEDDKYIAAALRYSLEQQKIAAAQAANPNAPRNEAALAAPLDALLNSASTPAADKPRYAYQRGALAYNGKQYPIAIQYFTQARQLGYTDPNLGLQIAQAKIAGGDIQGGLNDLNAEIDRQVAAGQKPEEDLYRYGVSRANQAKLGPQTVTWLQKYVTAYPTAKNWRDVIVTYGLSANSLVQLTDPQKIDLFRLMRQTKSLADQNDYLEYADDVQKRGLPAEAQAVLREGQAAGKIPASNALAKQLATEAANSLKLEASMSSLETKANAAPNGKLAASTADAYLGQDNFAKAVSLYRTALQKGGVDADEVNTRLGIALTRSGDKAAAKAAFAEVKGAPRAGIAGLWTTYLDAPAPTA